MPSITQARFDALVAIEKLYAAEGAELVAFIEVDHVRLDELCAQVQALKAALVERSTQLKAALVPAPSAPSEVEAVADKRTLMLVAKRCAASGMRVSLRGTALYALETGAVIAQVRS